MQMSRRTFFKVCAGGVGSSSIAMLGFSPGSALAEVREFKLTRSSETRIHTLKREETNEQYRSPYP